MIYTFKLNNKIFKIDLEEEKNKVDVEIDGEHQQVEYSRLDDNLYSIIVDGKSLTIGVLKKGKNIHVFYQGDLYNIEAISDRDRAKISSAGSGLVISSPMPSRIVKILKKVGDTVEPDEGVIVVEAMKMESELKAQTPGKVKDVKVKEGDTVEGGTVLVTLTADD